jgi:autotransporter-associated beta strand protein
MGLIVALASCLRGATFFWDGGHPGQDNWSLNQNWNPNGSPSNDGTANLVFTGTIRLTPNANGAWSINSLAFDAFAGAFTIGGDPVTLQANSVTYAIANNSSYTQTLTNALTLAAAQTWNANTANLSLSGTIALAANTLTLTGSANTTLSGVISGTGALVKTGTGTLTLTGANTYTGGTTVSAGTLQGDTTSLSGNITNNAAVTFDQATNGTYSGVISGTGALTKQNSGTLTLTGANTYSGATAVNAGTLSLGAANALGTSTAVSIASGATLQLATGAQTIASFSGAGGIDLGANTLTAGGSNASTTFSGTISGTGALVKNGTGTLTLTGANSYTGGTTISAGTLQGNTSSLTGNIANNAALVFDQSANGTFAGVISGTGSLTKQNAGTLTLTGANTYAGPTTISGGTLTLGSGGALNSINAVTIAGGATFQLGAGSQTIGSFAGAGNIDLGSFTLTSGGSNASTTFSGAIAGTGGLVKNGAGTLTLSGANTFTGTTTINAGSIVATTAGFGGAIVNNASLVLDQSTNGTYAGAISGTGSLIKQNTGTVILSGTNTYSGGTTVSAGTLQGNTTSLQGSIANNAAVVFDQAANGTYAGAMSGTGSLTKQNTGTLILSGANTYSGGTTVSGGALQGNTTSLQGSIANNAAVVFDQASNGTYAGVMSGTGSLTKQNSGTLILSGANTYAGGTIVSAGTLQGTTTSLQGNIANNAAVIFDQASNGTYAGTMSGTGSLTKLNAGTLTLSGTNTYSGGTTVSAGTLQGTTASLQGNIANNAAVVFDQATNGTYAGAMSGAGSLTKQNTGTVTLTGTNTYTGATTVNGGTLALGANNALSASSALTLNSSATFALGGFSTEVGTLTYNTSIIDFGAAGAANYFLFNGGSTSTGTLTVNNFSTGDGDMFAFRTGSTGVDTAFVSGIYFYGIGAGVIGATGQTIAGHSGTWDLITPNTAAFTTWDGGGTNNNWSTAANWVDDLGPVSSSTLRLAFDGTTRLTPSLNGNYNINTLRFNSTAGAFTLGATAGNSLTFDGVVPSMIQLSDNAQTIDVPVTLNTTTIVETTGAGNLTLSGVLSGTGGLMKVGINTLVLSGANTYSGNTTINAGTVILQNGTALGSTSAGTTVSSGATLQLENNISIGAEALALDGTLRNASGANLFGGTISGTGVVTIDGGSLTLGGTSANTYTGLTSINGGTLDLNKSAGVTAVAGNIAIGNGTGTATLRLLASNQIADTSAVTLNSAGTPVFNLNGFSETIGSLTSSNSAAAVQLGAGSLTTGGDNTSTTFAGIISGPGSLTKQGTGTFTLSGANIYSGTTTVSTGTLVVQNSSALGTTAGGTTVSSGATLQFENNVAIGAETLTLDGTLRSASGANSFGGAISGTGSVVVDAGSLSLGGTSANTYTGSTTVNTGMLDLNKTAGMTAVAGSLTIGNGTGSTTVRLLASNQIADTSAVTLASGGTPTLNLNGFSETIGSLASNNSNATVQLGAGSLTLGSDNTSMTFAGTISGSGGSLTKQGTGTLTLSGTSSYTGGTTVSAGTLQGTTSSLQGAILNNAAVVFDQTSSGTFAGAMSGTGSLTKQGSGTLTLSGANSYSGGTTVSAGTLQGTTGSLQGAIVNNATVVFNQATNGTYAGAMSGTGSLTKQNTGTVILTGTNTYTGGTTVSGGTLQGNTASLQGNIANNAAVVFDQAANGTYAGVMSGTGSLTKQNSGTLTLTGANSYSGGTTVTAGTLQGNTTSLQGNIANNAAIVFDQTTSGTFAGTISGTGSLTKQGAGTLSLSGTNTYTGATTVSSGTLALGASNALSSSTDLTLGSGATLSLSGFASQRVNTLNATNASLDFGTTGTANYFLLGNVGTTTGTFTVSNWTSGSDVFGIATNSVSQTFLDNVYFTGLNVGVGAVISSSPTTVSGYGSFYTLTPIPTFTWSGGQTTGNASDLDNWSKSGNWVGGIAPAVGAVKSLVLAGTVQTTTDMDGAYQIKGLLFRSDAGAFTINSSTGDSLIVAGSGILNESASTQTLNVSVALTSNQTWNAQGGNLVFSGATVLNGANTLTIDGAFNTTINSVIDSGSGGIVKNGTGTLTLAGANTFTGGVTLNAGTVSIASDSNLGAASTGLTFNGGTLLTSAALTSARAVTLNSGGGTLNTNGFNSTLSGAISGAGALTKTGSGTLTLTGANSYSGGTTISGGTLQGNTTSLQGNIANNAALVFDQSSSGTFAGNISGTGSVTKQNTGTLVLTGTNTYSGGTTVSAGTLQGSTTSLQGNIVNNASLVFNQATSGSYAGAISGTGSLTKSGAGSLTLTGMNSFTGATAINAGTLTLGANNALSSSTAITISSGATLDVAGYTLMIGSLSGTGTVALGSGHLSVGANNTSTTFGGSITGSGVLEKVGTGTLTFDASFSFAGELKLTGGTVALAGIDLSVGTLRISGNTVLDFGNSVASTLTATNIILENGATLTINNWVNLQDYFYATGSFYGLNTTTNVITTAPFDLRGIAPQNQLGFQNYQSAWTTWQSFDHQITPAPEPATYGALFVGAALGLVGVRRVRKRKAAR